MGGSALALGGSLAAYAWGRYQGRTAALEATALRKQREAETAQEAAQHAQAQVDARHHQEEQLRLRETAAQYQRQMDAERTAQQQQQQQEQQQQQRQEQQQGGAEEMELQPVGEVDLGDPLQRDSATASNGEELM